MEYIIETRGLTKKYGEKLAVNSVNMHIRPGEIYGFIGKNGAGKTTTMKMILGLTKQTSGTIKIFGSENLDKERTKIGSLIEAPGLYKNCSAFENMKRFSILYGGTDSEIMHLLNTVGLGDVGKKKVGEFSLGMKQRLGIAVALLGNPKLLILDEPINGLDPSAIKEVRDLILKLNEEKGVTFLISSHLLDELAKITTTYGIINNGVLVEEVSAEDLKERCRKSLKVKVSNPEKAVSVLKESGHLQDNEFSVEKDVVAIYSHSEKSEEVNEILVQNGIKVFELSSNSENFEDYFIERIGK